MKPKQKMVEKCPKHPVQDITRKTNKHTFVGRCLFCCRNYFCWNQSKHWFCLQITKEVKLSTSVDLTQHPLSVCVKPARIAQCLNDTCLYYFRGNSKHSRRKKKLKEDTKVFWYRFRLRNPWKLSSTRSAQHAHVLTTWSPRLFSASAEWFFHTSTLKLQMSWCAAYSILPNWGGYSLPSNEFFTARVCCSFSAW